MYVATDANQPSRKNAEFQFLKLWAHNELTNLRHHYNSGWALVGHDDLRSSEQGMKCERPDGGVYFLFPPSVVIAEGDTIAWGKSAGIEDEWVVTVTNRVREYVRCEVRRPRRTDLPIES